MSRNLAFCTQLARTYANMTRRLDTVLSSVHGISFSDYTILYHLHQAPEQKLRRIDLAERMGLTASGITRTLLPMEKLGWVTRVSDARDARVAYAVITEEGATLLANAKLTASERSDALLGAVPDAQLQELQTLLARLAT